MSLSKALRGSIRNAAGTTRNVDVVPKPRPTRRFSTLPPKPAVITVAITGDVPSKQRVKVPITPEEQVDSICRSFEAGARMVHVHVRDEAGKPSWAFEKYAQVKEGARKHCPDMILQFTTGNYAPDIEGRSKFIELQPEMASLTPGSVNFRASRPGEGIAKMYINTHEEIDHLAKKMQHYHVKPDVAIFDLSMIYSTAELVRRGLLSKPLRLMYVVGGHMALEARKEVLEFLVSESKAAFGEVDKDFTWCAVGVGWNHDSIERTCIQMGGHPRTGFEDSLMIKRGVFAQTNEELVAHIAKICKEYNRPIATPEQAREILGLAPKQK